MRDNENVKKLVDQHVLDLLKSSNFEVLFREYDRLEQIYDNKDLLKQLRKYNIQQWDFNDVEILTSLVTYWSENDQKNHPENRQKLIDYLLNSYKPGDYTLLRYKLGTTASDKEKDTIQSNMRSSVRYWYGNDGRNLFNIQFNIATSNSVADWIELHDKYTYNYSEHTPECGWFNYEIAWNIHHKGYSKEAKKYAVKAAEILNKNPVAINLLGLINYNLEDYKQAHDYFAEAEKFNDNTSETVYKGNVALALRNLKKYQEAIKLFKECLTINDNDGYKKEIAFCYNEIGHTFYKKKNYKKAYQNYQNSIKFDPSDYIFYENAGQSYRYDGVPEKAIVLFEKAAEHAPDNERKAKELNYIGVVHFEQMNYEKAGTFFKEAIDLFQNIALYHRNLGNAYDNLGDYDKAILCFKKSAELEALLKPKAADYNSVGLMYTRKLKDANALKYYQKAHELDPERSVYVANIAYSYRYMNEYEKAVQVYKKAISVDSDMSSNYYDLGMVLDLMGKNSEALHYFEQAKKLDPTNAEYKTAFQNQVNKQKSKTEAKGK